ncbi:MAG: hypothetical protein IKS83_01830 [Victivallales bacterium]|nr:hypothetical protein [Victivallales bacterium]
MCRFLSIILLLAGLFAPLALVSEEASPSNVVLAEEEVPFSELPAKEFLRILREPMAQDAWGEFTGRIIHQRKGQQKLQATLRVRITFTPDSLYAQLVLNDQNVYGLEQLRETAGKTIQHLDLPDQETKPSLFDFGVSPSDLSFSFIYWDFVQELPRDSSRWQECRVMRLADPSGNGDFVDVWFQAEYGFPMEAKWYHGGEAKPWRTLLMQGAKKFENGLWFVKEMRLDGDTWKTQVKFDFAEKNEIGTGQPAAETVEFE